MAQSELRQRIEGLIGRVLKVKKEIENLREKHLRAAETELPLASLGMPGDSKTLPKLDRAILQWRNNLYECLEDCDAFVNLYGDMDKYMNLSIVRAWNNPGARQIYFYKDCLLGLDRLVGFLNYRLTSETMAQPKPAGVPVPKELPSRLQKAIKSYPHTQNEACRAMGIKDPKTLRRLLRGTGNFREDSVRAACTYIESAPVEP